MVGRDGKRWEEGASAVDEVLSWEVQACEVERHSLLSPVMVIVSLAMSESRSIVRLDIFWVLNVARTCCAATSATGACKGQGAVSN